MSKQHMATEETLLEIRNALETRGLISKLEWSEEAGAYTNASVAAMLDTKRDGMPYGVSIPKGSATECAKTGANAQMGTPVPGVVGVPASDPYAGVGPFWHMDVNGFVDADGTPHVTALDGDANFARDGSNGDVWVLAPVLWWKFDGTGENAVTITVSDSKLAGFEAQPQAYLPDGTLRPYMLYAKYVGVKGEDGYMHSWSGRKPWKRNVSHNSLITQCRTASTGYSGKSGAYDGHLKVMFLLK